MPDPVQQPRSLGAEEKGTLFPSLDGSAPGDQPLSGDITGQVLDELVPKDDTSFASGSSLSVIPQTEGAAAPTQDGEQVAAGEIDPPVDRKRRTASDRIAQLTRKYRQEQEANGGLNSQLAQLTQIVQRQNDQIQALRGLPQSRPLAEPSPDPLGALGEPTQSPARPAIVSADDIAAVVSRTIEAHESKRNARDAEVRQSMQRQEQSFNEAAEELPELRDARTRAYKVFNEVYQASPMRTFDDAPYQIMLQVKGILADEAQAPRGTAPVRSAPIDQRKLQAATITPRPQSTDAPQLNRATIQKAYDDVCRQLKAGDKTPDTYIKWRKLRGALKGNR